MCPEMGEEITWTVSFLLRQAVHVSSLAWDLEVGFSPPTSGLWPPAPQGVVSSWAWVPTQCARESPIRGEEGFSADGSIVLGSSHAAAGPGGSLEVGALFGPDSSAVCGSLRCLSTPGTGVEALRQTEVPFPGP